MEKKKAIKAWAVVSKGKSHIKEVWISSSMEIYKRKQDAVTVMDIFTEEVVKVSITILD